MRIPFSRSLFQPLKSGKKILNVCKTKKVTKAARIIKPNEKSGSGVKHLFNISLFMDITNDNDFHYHKVMPPYVQFFLHMLLIYEA